MGKSQPNQALEPLNSVNDAAAYLKLHPRTVKALLKNGELVGHVVAGRWRITSEDLRRFVQEAPTEWNFAGAGEDGN